MKHSRTLTFLFLGLLAIASCGGKPYHDPEWPDGGYTPPDFGDDSKNISFADMNVMSATYNSATQELIFRSYNQPYNLQVESFREPDGKNIIPIVMIPARETLTISVVIKDENYPVLLIADIFKNNEWLHAGAGDLYKPRQ